ncbi:sterol desaturase family protein [Xanthomonas hortorum]|uniref:sterol desaturase family protein n=1 Tax=Xanthomonas hortorum TaxID=56454 RepID=UPI002115620F|nr:sterol desaturase family protein [Xanthomonas hortorum]UUE98756.1 sterol desaturase family protein [Xanthomonas hortorum pv. pelargonii]UUF02991.1 sterol desaturase family protein [Xanthomonas hortorum pv. pelargonii]
MARPHHRSFFAHASALLGVLSLMGVVCFHFPDLLTSREFRAAYNEQFARHLLLVGLVAAFLLGTFAILRDRNKRIAMVGVGSATLAVLFGGTNVQFDTIGRTPYSLGLDWFVISLFFSALVFVPLERYLGKRRISPLRQGWRTDIGYFFMSHVLVQFILILVTASTSSIAGLAAFPSLKAAIQSLPVWGQFLIAVFVADMAQASLHRAYHNIPWLWRFHAVHHSSREMDWLAGSRIHFVEIVLTRSAVLLPLLILGFSTPAVNAYVILVGLQAVLAHSNLGLRFGWLEYVLVLPRYHHWHHARQQDYIDVNYAIHLPLVDMLMGTFKLPPSRDAWPQEYGVMKLETVPKGLMRQHLMPFRRRKTFDDYVD